MAFATELLIRYPEIFEFTIDDEQSNSLEPAAASIYFKRKGLADREINKLLAAYTLVKTNFFWTNFYHWCNLSTAISIGLVPSVGSLFPDPEDFGWSIIEAVLLTPTYEECKFTDGNIIAYVLEEANSTFCFPFTYKPFIPKHRWEKFDATDETVKLNNSLVIRARNLITAIKKAFSERNETINQISMNDIEKRMLLFKSTYEETVA
jgi:hypothetical protein